MQCILINNNRRDLKFSVPVFLIAKTFFSLFFSVIFVGPFVSLKYFSFPYERVAFDCSLISNFRFKDSSETYMPDRRPYARPKTYIRRIGDPLHMLEQACWCPNGSPIRHVSLQWVSDGSPNMVPQPFITRKLTRTKLTARKLRARKLRARKLRARKLRTHKLRARKLRVHKLKARKLRARKLRVHKLTARKVTTRKLTTRKLTTHS